MDAWRARASVPLGDPVQCELGVTALASFDDATGGPAPQIEVARSEPESITFSGLAGEHPKIKARDGERALTLVKATGTEWILLDQDAAGTPITYLISRLTRSVMITKAYTNIAGKPFAFVTTGRCQ